jgi:hypothetical protein
MSNGVPGVIEGAVDAVHGAISSLLGTSAPAVKTPTPAAPIGVITLAQAETIIGASGGKMSVIMLQAMGYVIVG